MAIKVLKLKDDETNTLELVEIVLSGNPDWTDVQNKPSTFPPSAHNHDGSYSAIGHNHDGSYSAVGHNHDGTYATTGHNHTGTYEPANSNIQTHVNSAHAPSNAQKNSDITKAEIEAKLTGEISTHTHAGGAGAVITETEIDVGATPVQEASIPVTNAGVTASSKIIGGVAYKAPTGKDLDELEMDALDIKFEPGSGTFNVKIKGLEGYIADKFIIWYQVAA